MVEVVVVAVVGNSKTDSATLGSNKEGAIMPTKSRRREDPPGEESPAGSPPKRQRVDGGGGTPSPKAVDDKRGEGAAGSGPCLRCAGCGANDDGRAPLLLFDDPEEDQEAAAGDRKADREERR